MKNIYLWALKHRGLASVLVFVLITVGFSAPLLLLSWALDTSFSWEFGLLFALLGLLWAWLLPNFCVQLLTQKPLEEMHRTCDPYPFLEITRELLALPLSNDLRQISTINYCVALQETGQYAEAYSLLSGLNMDIGVGAAPTNKAVYYNNLADLCFLMGDYPQADLWYSKLMQLYQSMRPGKVKNTLARPVTAAAAAWHFRRGEYPQVVAALNSTRADNLCAAVNSAVLDAQAHIAMGRFDIAADRLNYVIANGNRLHAVTVARELLPRCAPTPSASTPAP